MTAKNKCNFCPFCTSAKMRQIEAAVIDAQGKTKPMRLVNICEQCYRSRELTYAQHKSN